MKIFKVKDYYFVQFKGSVYCDSNLNKLIWRVYENHI